MTKTCTHCGITKPIEDFPRYKQPHGIVPRAMCRECKRIENRAYKQSASGKAANAAWWKGAKGQAYTRTQDERRRGTVKHRARVLANLARLSGKLKPKPCERCGAAKVEMHHDDYSKPLQVRFLCNRCHKIEHGVISE
jgi:ribosomal protein S27AE